MPGKHWGLGMEEGGVQEHGDLPDGQRLQGTILIGSQIQQTITMDMLSGSQAREVQ